MPSLRLKKSPNKSTEHRRWPPCQLDPMTFSKEAISLYRAAFRTINARIPVQTRSKLLYNVREMFDIYRDVKDQERRTYLLQEGWHDLGVVRELLKAEPGILENLFKHYEALPTSLNKKIPSAEVPSVVSFEGQPPIPNADVETLLTN